MFPIWIKNGKNKRPENSPIYYILAKNGFLISKKTKFWNAIVPVDNISILEPETPSIELLIPQIPKELTFDIVRFFVWVYRKHGTEAALTLHYNEESRSYRIYAPKQEVSCGHVDYKMPENLPGEVLIGTFHSHCRMSAFHSSIDRHDESAVDGIHGVIGRLSSFLETNDFEFSLKAVVGGTSFLLNPEEMMRGLLNASNADKIENTKYAKIFSFEKKPRFSLYDESVLLPKTYAPPEEWEKNILVKSWLRDLFERKNDTNKNQNDGESKPEEERKEA